MSLNRSILRPKELQNRETHSRVRLNLDREKKQEEVSKLSFERWRSAVKGRGELEREWKRTVNSCSLSSLVPDMIEEIF